MLNPSDLPQIVRDWLWSYRLQAGAASRAGRIAEELHPLLEHLVHDAPPADDEWRGWRIRLVPGGANGLLYHVVGATGDFAVKFTPRDRRQRASREYAALSAIAEADLPLAPRPVLLDCRRYRLPVVVQTWLEGEVDPAPPATDDDWRRLLAHYVAARAITPATTRIALPAGVLIANSATACLATVRHQIVAVPPKSRPDAHMILLRRLQAIAPRWPAPAVGLCRLDANTLNFIRRPEGWASVDWENSGWGDPAFEIADLMSHPAYLDVPPSRWEWLVELYSRLTDDPAVITRIRFYYQSLLVWWMARQTRYLYEAPLGRDRRLAARSPDWQARVQAQYTRYSQLAMDALETPPFV